MNDSAKSRLFAGSTVLLLVTNTIVISFIFFGPHPPRPDKGKMIMHELKFEEDQRLQFRKLKEEQLAVIKAVNVKDGETHRALFNGLRSGQDLTPVSDSMIRQIGEDRIKIETATYHHLAEVRRMCSDEQKKKFDNIIADIMTPWPGGR